MGIILGFVVGFALRLTEPTSKQIEWLGRNKYDHTCTSISNILFFTHVFCFTRSVSHVLLHILVSRVMLHVMCSTYFTGLPGSLFLRLLKLTIVPVITSSIIVGESNIMYTCVRNDIFIQFYFLVLKNNIVWNALNISSHVVGTSRMKPAENGRLGICLMVIIVVNACMAIVVGSILVISIKPGIG